MLLHALNPACFSNIAADCGFSLFRITFSIMFLGWLIRLLVWYIVLTLQIPFVGRVTINDCVNAFGHLPFSHKDLQMGSRTWFQSTHPTSGGAVIADDCANCDETPCPPPPQ